jgi:protein-L-isoaspartate(D-aspartate) O-methyltransferase
MVIPVGEGEVQQMKKITISPERELIEELYDQFSFVPMLSGKKS